MVPKIGQFLNRTVLVSIPVLNGDCACRPYRLLGVELQGMWLQSDDLNRSLLADDMHDFAEQAAPVAFIPFAQIAGVLIPTAPPAPAPQKASRTPAKRAARRPRTKP
jgi:hypothetical protein